LATLARKIAAMPLLRRNEMSKLTRFFAISLLVLSMSAVAFADGGEMQGPGSPEPPPPSDMQGPGVPSSSTGTPVDTASSDVNVILAGSEEFARWILNRL
jgi:hypothetical protein